MSDMSYDNSADLDLNFELDTSQTSLETVIPEGQYEALVSHVQKKVSKKDNISQYAAFEFQIASGDFVGRKLFYNINLWHIKPSTCDLAKKDIKRLCLSIWGEDKRISSLNAFLDQIAVVMVKNGKNDSGEDRSEIKGFVKKGGNAPAGTSTAYQDPNDVPF